MQRAWKRKSFLAGLVIFMGLLYSLTSIVWTIEVEGTKNLSPETIVAAADSVGIHKGSWIGRLPDTDLLQAEMLDKVPELSWVGVRIQGTKVSIQVVEKVPPTVHTPGAPQHVIASKKAIIDKVLVEKGVPAVQKGQMVNPGDVLISGTLANGNNVQAKGKVEATVWYGTDLQIPLEHLRKQYTGPSFKKHYLVVGSFPIQVWGYGQNPYQSYEEHAVDREFHIGSFTLPIRFRTAVVKETKEEKIILTEDEARQEALQRAGADVAAKIGESGRVIDQKILHQRSEHGNLYVKVLNIVKEDIGKPQPF
jgi:similar to stage IV sporulation protein